MGNGSVVGAIETAGISYVLKGFLVACGGLGTGFPRGTLDISSGVVRAGRGSTLVISTSAVQITQTGLVDLGVRNQMGGTRGHTAFDSRRGLSRVAVKVRGWAPRRSGNSGANSVGVSV